jgi:anhydro-N-acetylmuramic acid kinase
MYIGLMSGTSVDAVDGVLAEFDGDAAASPGRALAIASRPIPEPLRRELLALQAAGHDELERAALAAIRLTDLYADVVRALRVQAGASCAVTAIGAHGQTVRHRPELGFTLQLLNGARLAEATGCAVACDFRSADIAAGGQGAPLVPAYHALAFAHPARRRTIVNIGGIANVSLIEAGGGAVTGFDTGPGNLLMDAWCDRHRGAPYDDDGRWAASGRVDAALLTGLLSEPYFARTPPKSTGRDLFGLPWLEQALTAGAPSAAAPPAAAHGAAHAPVDVQATLAELTATTIARACRAFGAHEVWVCGGGALNGHLMGRLAALAAPVPVSSTAALGIPPLAVEAMAFAWLARERLAGRAASLPAVTGARAARVLGALYPAP